MNPILFLTIFLLASGHASASDPIFNTKTDLEASIRRTRRGMEILDLVLTGNLTLWEAIVRASHFFNSVGVSWTVLLTTSGRGKYVQEEALVYKTFRFSWDHDRTTTGPVEPSCEEVSSTFAQVKKYKHQSFLSFFCNRVHFHTLTTLLGGFSSKPQTSSTFPS